MKKMKFGIGALNYFMIGMPRLVAELLVLRIYSKMCVL
jgi:hypothetical protein